MPHATRERVARLALRPRPPVPFTPVPHTAPPQSAAAVVGGVVELSLTDLGGSLPLIRAGKLRALATTGVARHRDLPEVPTIAESGFPGYSQYVWIGFGVHGRTPDASVARLEAAMQAVVASPEFRAFNEVNGNAEIIGLDGRRSAEMIASEIARYRALVKSLEK